MPKKKIHRQQFAALPLRDGEDGRAEILLITSRDTGRWVIPKGWPMKGRKPHEAAAQEAWEEAGVLGRIKRAAVGHYGYDKTLADGSAVHCRVKVFPLHVETMDTTWPELGERRRRWFALDEAAGLVNEPELAALIRAAAPRRARKAAKAERAEAA